jgi:hypothetical protein
LFSDFEHTGDIGLDPFYKLVFPTMDMLTQEHQDLLNNACDAGDPKEIKATVEIIREALNPHPAGQKTLNAPKKAELTGVQHKYAETVLFFAAAAQTCHAYCTYCFRWAQFIGDADLRFAQKDADSLFDYLEEHEEVSVLTQRLFRTFPNFKLRRWRLHDHQSVHASRECTETVSRLYMFHTGHPFYRRRPHDHEDEHAEAVPGAVQGSGPPAAHQELEDRHAGAHVLAAAVYHRSGC